VTQDLLAAVVKGAVPLTTAAIESELTNDRLTIAMTASCDGDGFVLSGEKRFVQAARDASTLVVAARLDGALALFAVPRGTAGVDVERLKPLDWSALDSVKFDSVVVPAESLIAKGTEAERLLREALCQSDILLSAELCGLAEAALDLAVEYAKIRETYGKPIGQYQAVKHRLVNLRADIEIGKALVRAAAGAVTSQSAGWRLASAQAAYWSIDAVKKVPEGCLQVFGGIGFTWEHDIHLYLRRCATLASQLGERAEHREVIVEALDKGRFGGASADAA
jgi:alkylation response protein AidB-like acyl-CoA dehydrogenase